MAHHTKAVCIFILVVCFGLVETDADDKDYHKEILYFGAGHDNPFTCCKGWRDGAGGFSASACTADIKVFDDHIGVLGVLSCCPVIGGRACESRFRVYFDVEREASVEATVNIKYVGGTVTEKGAWAGTKCFWEIDGKGEHKETIHSPLGIINLVGVAVDILGPAFPALAIHLDIAGNTKLAKQAKQIADFIDILDVATDIAGDVEFVHEFHDSKKLTPAFTLDSGHHYLDVGLRTDTSAFLGVSMVFLVAKIEEIKLDITYPGYYGPPDLTIGALEIIRGKA